MNKQIGVAAMRTVLNHGVFGYRLEKNKTMKIRCLPIAPPLTMASPIGSKEKY